MTSIVIARAGRYLADARGAASRAPVESACALFLAATFSWAIETRTAQPAWFEVAVVSLLVALAAWGATLLHALGAWSARRRWTVTLGTALAAAVYGTFVLDLDRGAEGWRALMLLGAFASLVFAAPGAAAATGGRTELMRTVNARVALRGAGAAIYGATLFAGLALALAAVDNLFELRLDGAIYGHVFAWIFLALVPGVVIGGLPAYVDRAHGEDRVSAVVHRMSAFLVPPLLAVYLAILLAYVGRIAVTGEMPKNLLSPMVIAAGSLAILSLLLFSPTPGARSALRWLRASPVVMLPLAALGIWSIGIRLEQYGWTEFRALRVLVLALMMALAACAALDLLRRRRFPLVAAPLALAVILAAAAAGPWSVQDISRRSQQERLAAALRDAGVDPAVPRPRDVAIAEIDASLYDEIDAGARYLRRNFGAAALPPALAAGGGDAFASYAELVGLRRAPGGDAGIGFASASLAEGSAVPDADGDSYYRVRVGPPGRGPGGGAMAIAAQDGLRLHVQLPGTRLQADLAGLERALRGRSARGGTFGAGEALLALTDELGYRAGSLLLLDVSATWDDGTFRVDHLDGIVVLGAR